jgi:glycosyltransferase involved in cell wall biosynthesis
MDAHDVLLVLPGCEIDGLEVLAAMSAGLALVAFEGDPTASPYMIDTANGLAAPAGDIAGLRARLFDLADRPDRRALLSHGALETIRTGGFDLDRVCDNYAEMLAEMFAELRSGGHVPPPPVYVHPELGGMSLAPALLRHPDAIDRPR